MLVLLYSYYILFSQVIFIYFQFQIVEENAMFYSYKLFW